MNSDLILTRGEGKRAYEYQGTSFTKPWVLRNSKTGETYNSKDEYDENIKKKAFASKMKKGKAKAAAKKKAVAEEES